MPSGLCSKAAPERTLLIILALVPSKLSPAHRPVSYSFSEIIMLTCLGFVSPTLTFYDFWGKGAIILQVFG